MAFTRGPGEACRVCLDIPFIVNPVPDPVRHVEKGCQGIGQGQRDGVVGVGQTRVAVAVASKPRRQKR